MIREGKFLGYTKTEQGERCNEWRVGREDNKNCEFPSEERIKELGSNFLGTTDDGSPRLLDVKRGENYLILRIVPKTDRGKISSLFCAIGLETK